MEICFAEVEKNQTKPNQNNHPCWGVSGKHTRLKSFISWSLVCIRCTDHQPSTASRHQHRDQDLHERGKKEVTAFIC